MARGKSRTKKCRTLVEDLDADDSSKKRSIFGDTKAEGTNSRGASDDEDSNGSQDDADISVKKQGSGTVYDRTPTKRGSWDPQAPAYTANSNPMDLYTKKGDDSSNEEDQYKRKDADDNTPGLQIVVTTETMIPTKTKNRKEPIPTMLVHYFSLYANLPPNVLRLWVTWAIIQWMI